MTFMQRRVLTSTQRHKVASTLIQYCLNVICPPGNLHYQLQYEFPLRKHAYSNVLKILPPKNEKISDKKF